MNATSDHSDAMQCVFRCGASWLSIPATAVREVALLPATSLVPETGPVLLGLCHFRNEFLPVVSGRVLFDESTAPAESHLIVIQDGRSHWGLAVNRVDGLQLLESSISATEAAESFRLGWATYAGEAVQVLDVASLHRAASNLIDRTTRPPLHAAQIAGSPSFELLPAD